MENKSTTTRYENSSQWLFLQRNPEYAAQPASYGMNLMQLEELRLKQARGEEIEEVPCNQDPSYTIPKHEENHFVVFHLKFELFDGVTGQDLGYEKLVKYNIATYMNLLKRELLPKASKVRIVHLPESVVIKEQELVAQKERQEAKARQNEEAEMKRRKQQLERELKNINNNLAKKTS